MKEGDPFARNDLINGNLKLVLSILKNYNNKVDNLDDLFQVGCVGLLKAIEKNKRESYSELLDDVVYNAIGCIENIDKACEYSNNIKTYYLMSIGEYEGDYFAHSDNEILDTLKDVYKFMLKDKLEF